MPAGSKAVLIRRISVQLLGSQALFQVGQLGRADAVLAGDGAAELDGGAEDVGESALGPGDPLGVRSGFQHAGRMQVAVAGMAERRHGDPVPRGDLVDARDHLGQPRPGHAGVLENRQRAQPGQRGQGTAPGGQQRFGLGDVTGGLDVDGAGARAGGSDPLEAACHGRLVAVVAEQQQGTGVGMQPQVRVLLDRVHAAAVEELQRRRDDAGAEDAGDRVAGLGQRVEVGQPGAAGRWLGEKRHRHLGDHAEGALGPGDQPGQVVAGDILPEPAAGPDDLAGRQGHRQPQHVVAGHAVLQPPQAAGAGGDVAADRGDGMAARIWRVEQAVGCRGVVERLRRDPGLGAGQHLLRRDLEHAAHPHGRQARCRRPAARCSRRGWSRRRAERPGCHARSPAAGSGPPARYPPARRRHPACRGTTVSHRARTRPARQLPAGDFPVRRWRAARSGPAGESGAYRACQAPTRMTSRVRGPCTPSTRLSSMSLVADGPLIQVSGQHAGAGTLVLPRAAESRH